MYLGARAIFRSFLIVAFLFAVLVVVGARPANACGCGMVINATDTAEQALVTYHYGRETIIPGLNLESVGVNAAVVLPVPNAPKVRALPGDLNLFAVLDSATAPSVPSSNSSGVGMNAAAAGPTVVSQQTVGGYQVTVLLGGTGNTLSSWLGSHHYNLAANIQAGLQRYVTREWYFVAIRLADQRIG